MNDYDNKLRLYKANNIRWFTILFWGKFLQISIEIFLRMKGNVESLIWGWGKVYFQHSKEPTVYSHEKEKPPWLQSQQFSVQPHPSMPNTSTPTWKAGIQTRGS